MAGGFDNFNGRMRQHGQRVVKNANAIKRKAAVAVDATVVLATPVDTGRARSNWQASLNAPSAGELEAYAPGEGGSTGGANANAAMQQARGVIEGAQPEQGIYLTNNLPYIGRLNDGWSAQAPAGFVEEAVLVGIATVKGLSAKIVSGNIDDGN